MTHCGVPLHRYGQGKVNGASEANLCQGEQDGYKVEVERVQAHTKSMMIISDVKSCLFYTSFIWYFMKVLNSYCKCFCFK